VPSYGREVSKPESKLIGEFMVLVAGACLLSGLFSGRMPVKWFPDATRKANPLTFWSVAIFYSLAVALGVWMMVSPI
jgi:lipid-A-disaccharide synthase-like uncharacterized protein